MKDYYQKTCKAGSKAIVELKAEIEINKLRIANAQQLMVDGELPASDYREIKNWYEEVIQKLERELIAFTQVDTNLMLYVSATGDILRNLPVYYDKASLPVKQKIVSSIFTGKIIYDGKECRTQELNEVVSIIRALGAASEETKKGQASKIGSLSDQVIPLGLYQRHY